jgi:hypothetical protein
VARGRDWPAEIDRWTERFRGVPDPPAAFADALRDGWEPEARARLAAEAEAYAVAHAGYVAQMAAAGVDLVRLDCKQGSCGHCARLCGSAYSLVGATPELPSPPPLPICPACRHTLNMLTPFWMTSLGLTVEDLAAEAQAYDEDEGSGRG